MKKKLFIHVGPHKTGTTVIQKICLDNDSNLQSMNFLYPKTFFSFIGHHELVNQVRKRSVSEEAVKNLADSGLNILLSSENFIDFNLADWRYVKEIFSNFDIHIIYTWRRSSLKMYSIWQESIKHGESETFYAYYYSDLIRPGVSDRLSQINNLDRMEGVIGFENIHILDYEALSENKSLLSEFFKIMNIDSNQLGKKQHSEGVKNASMKPGLTELLRCLNSLHEKKGYTKSSQVRERFFAKKKSLEDVVKKTFFLMDGCYKEVSFGDYFVDKSSEKRIYQKYKPRLVGYEKKSIEKKIDIVDQQWLLHPDALKLLSVIYTEISK
ncbi:MAG: hypothetical protein ABJE79_00865 [Marinomonas sp.]